MHDVRTKIRQHLPKQQVRGRIRHLQQGLETRLGSEACVVGQAVALVANGAASEDPNIMPSFA